MVPRNTRVRGIRFENRLQEHQKDYMDSGIEMGLVAFPIPQCVAIPRCILVSKIRHLQEGAKHSIIFIVTDGIQPWLHTDDVVLNAAGRRSVARFI